MNFAADFEISIRARAMIDASAAFGIVQRRAFCKIRNIDVQWLWLQERMHNGDVKAANALGKENRADLMTKHLGADDMTKHVGRFGFEMRNDRSDKSLKINQLRKPLLTHGRATNSVLSGGIMHFVPNCFRLIKRLEPRA